MDPVQVVGIFGVHSRRIGLGALVTPWYDTGKEDFYVFLWLSLL